MKHICRHEEAHAAGGISQSLDVCHSRDKFMNNGKDKKTLPCKKFRNSDSVFMNKTCVMMVQTECSRL